MQFMMVSGSHSPLLDLASPELPSVADILSALAATQSRIEAFDPDLVVLLGVDHYGGHQMSCMPAFSVAVEATSIADIGGSPGKLPVPKDTAVAAVNALRQGGVDVAVSYAMDVDHGFSQIMKRTLGGIDRYPVLPIFVSCIQPPFVPFARARALGEQLGKFAMGLDYQRVLFMGTGGLAHNPEMLFPTIDNVSDEWRPYHLFGKGQTEVPQQSWIDYQIEAHKFGAQMMLDETISAADFGLNKQWDAGFMQDYCSGDLARLDDWQPEQVVADAGIGAVEVLSWVAAAQAMQTATGSAPQQTFYTESKEVGLGFGIAEAGPSFVVS